MRPHSISRRREGGSSIVEMMIVATVFVLVATTIYRSLTNITRLQGATDSAVVLQLQGQKALNRITSELRTAGFFRPQPDNTIASYDSALWTTKPEDDPHATWDVPYLFAGEGSPNGAFGALAHTAASHKADSSDEEFDATRELCFVSLGSLVPNAGPAIASVEWASSGLGAASSLVLPLTWQLVSYELHEGPDGVNCLKRIVRPVDSATMSIGAPTSEETLARFVEAVRFDTAQTDASLALYTVKITLWLRKVSPAGDFVQAKVQSRVKLRNSVH